MRYPYHKPDKADAEEGLFNATITAVHGGSAGRTGSASAEAATGTASAPTTTSATEAASSSSTSAESAGGSLQRSISGLASMAHRRSFSGGAAPVTVDIRYTDEVQLTFGDQPETAGLNVLDSIPEVGAMWRLWVRGLSVDVTVPDEAKAAPEDGRGRNAAGAGAHSTSPHASAVEDHTPPSAVGGVDGADSLGASERSEHESSLRSDADERDGARDDALSGAKTISVDWADPTSEQHAAGVYGSLVFTVSLPLVFLRAHLRAGRFWSDSSLLKLGRFSDATIVTQGGEVHSTIRISFEREGAYLAIESLSLAVQAIRIESISEHSKRWGLLLGTVSGLQWLLSGFLERKLLDLVAAAVVAETQRQRLVKWSEIPLFTDFGARLNAWQAAAAVREALEGKAIRRIQRSWRAHQQVLHFRPRRRRMAREAHDASTNDARDTTEK